MKNEEANLESGSIFRDKGKSRGEPRVVAIPAIRRLSSHSLGPKPVAEEGARAGDLNAVTTRLVSEDVHALAGKRIPVVSTGEHSAGNSRASSPAWHATSYSQNSSPTPEAAANARALRLQGALLSIHQRRDLLLSMSQVRLRTEMPGVCYFFNISIITNF